MICPLCRMKINAFYRRFTPHDIHFYHTSIAEWFSRRFKAA